MKKLMSLILISFLLIGCGGEKQKADTTYIVEAKDVDMSVYEGISSTNHAFKETQVSELTKCLNEKGSAVFYIGYKECGHCQELLKHLNEVAMELGVTIYYINGTDADGNFAITGHTYDELLEDITPIADKDDKGMDIPSWLRKK